jgi:hypothetical protein
VTKHVERAYDPAQNADVLVIGRGLINASRLPTNAYVIIRK